VQNTIFQGANDAFTKLPSFWFQANAAKDLGKAVTTILRGHARHLARAMASVYVSHERALFPGNRQTNPYRGWVKVLHHERAYRHPFLDQDVTLKAKNYTLGPFGGEGNSSKIIWFTARLYHPLYWIEYDIPICTPLYSYHAEGQNDTQPWFDGWIWTQLSSHELRLKNAEGACMARNHEYIAAELFVVGLLIEAPGLYNLGGNDELFWCHAYACESSFMKCPTERMYFNVWQLKVVHE
jgi:hypothetical protein